MSNSWNPLFLYSVSFLGESFANLHTKKSYSYAAWLYEQIFEDFSFDLPKLEYFRSSGAPASIIAGELVRLIVWCSFDQNYPESLGYLKMFVLSFDWVIHFEGVSMLDTKMKSELWYLNLLSDQEQRTVENINRDVLISWASKCSNLRTVRYIGISTSPS